jgi:hypothetical protein
MPIRSEMRRRYPANWKAITARIRERAGDRCECTGQCGSVHDACGSKLSAPRCNAPNRTLIRRAEECPERWWLHTCTGVCAGGECDGVMVVLTVAHLNHTPEDVHDENLLALCQRCHLRLDADEHRANAAATRARTRDERTGQTPLFTPST